MLEKHHIFAIFDVDFSVFLHHHRHHHRRHRHHRCRHRHHHQNMIYLSQNVHKFTLPHGCQIYDKNEPDWHKMGQNCDL